ncbi:helicase HerA-like domain-containing protein [Naumannella halotolerans]|uniref:helicase HerA-like domain-containing protein n=1 Tax=Naumannella halotolerans TaxID=993414 RepID=UPI00370DC74B
MTDAETSEDAVADTSVSPVVAEVTEGYAFDEPAIEIGVLVEAEQPVPTAKVRLPLAMMNRHGLVAGATGTGKTKTLQVLAEQLSAAGVPVFAADIKGDLSGIAAPGEPSEKLDARVQKLGQDWQPRGFPTEFYALGDDGSGTPLRATVSSFGPILMAKVLDLNEVQESTLGLVFSYADKSGLALLDLSDLRAVLMFLTSDDGKDELKQIGGVSKATVGVILRKLTNLADQGADAFFGEPEFDTEDLLVVDADGAGRISLLELPNVQDRPALFSTFLMWLLADLFASLPEVGDLEKPKLVFFFDEAHLLFNDASDAFLDAIAQTVRLIRSKGVGVFFVTQTPKDVPDEVLAQLGSRVQHQLRAHTPNDAKALKQTVATFPKSTYDLAEALTALGTGEAIVTVMDPDGAPTPVAWTRILAPESLMAPIAAEDLAARVKASAQHAKYGQAIDRESAREKLAARLDAGAAAEPAPAGPAPADQPGDRQPSPGQQAPTEPAEPAPKTRRTKAEPSMFEKLSKNTMVRQVARTATREIFRSIFGNARRR